jgi:hypothetical protein
MKTVAKTCYYAHSLHLYETAQEARDILTIEQLGFKVVNPNAPEHQKPYEKEGMDYFVDLANSCDVLAFRAHPNGEIPAGVHKEVINFIKTQRPVFELPWGINRRGMSVDDTREWLHELGER